MNERRLQRCLLIGVLFMPVVAFGNGPSTRPTVDELIDAMIARPSPGKNEPKLPVPSTAVRGMIEREASNESVMCALTMLDAKQHRNVDWFKAIEVLETSKAVWMLQACLSHPSPDVQIRALGALGRLNDRAAVPFLLVYSYYVAVPQSGSEEATIHAIVLESLAKTLSSITGIEVKLHGQDIEELNRGLRLWTRWLTESDAGSG